MKGPWQNECMAAVHMIPDLASAVATGDIVYDNAFLQSGAIFIPLYVANGYIGGSFDEFGFHSRSNFDTDNGRTHLACVNHYSKRLDNNGGHILRSLFHATARYADDEPLGLAFAQHYKQRLDLWQGQLQTQWTERESHFHTTAFASFACPQLWQWQGSAELAEQSHALKIDIALDVRSAENNARRPSSKMEVLETTITGLEDNCLCVTSKTDCQTTTWYLYTEGFERKTDRDAIQLIQNDRHALMRVLIIDEHLDEQIAANPAQYVAQCDAHNDHLEAMQEFWSTTGNILLPEGGPEAGLWWRLKYFTAAGLSPVPSHIQVTTGLNANIWAHGFPQDQWYAMMPLPRLGMFDRSAAQMPYYNDVDGLRTYTRRLAKREGIFIPWEAPFENLADFEKEQITNLNTYQFHNSAYVVAMLWESYLVHGDVSRIEPYFDLIEGIAEFYINNSTIEGDKPAIFENNDIDLRSQDEHTVAGAVTINPICSVWSSTYALGVYIELCELLDKSDATFKKIAQALLDRGYDMDSLLREDGTLKTSASDPRPSGQQKHPPQLNPITYVPMAKWMDWEPVQTSWRERYGLCENTHAPISYGWTFGQYTLASARMGDGQAVQDDLSLVQPARFADPHWIQFYESSCRNGWSHKKPYYFTVMGLYLAALNDCVVQDCRGFIDIFPALLPRWNDKDIYFENMHMCDGLIISGKLINEDCKISIICRHHQNIKLRIGQAGTYVAVLGPNEKVEFAGGEIIELESQANMIGIVSGS